MKNDIDFVEAICYNKTIVNAINRNLTETTDDISLNDRKRLYFEEGSQYYYGNLFIPDDLESLEL